MKRSAFGKKRAPKIPLWALLAAAAAVLVALFELYSVVVPFQSNNPLWHQVTVGQPVIDNWDYGGQDEEGYLKFFSQGESVVLPPTAKLFSADGQFVIIEGYSPSSLTYASPLEAIPLGWLIGLVSAVALGGWVFLHRRKHRSTLTATANARGSRRFTTAKRKWPARGRKRHRFGAPSRSAQFRARPSGRPRPFRK